MRLAANKELQDVKRDVVGEYVDYAESQLLKAVENGKAWAIVFFLRHKGQARGYIENPKASIANVAGGLTVEFIDSLVHSED